MRTTMTRLRWLGAAVVLAGGTAWAGATLNAPVRTPGANPTTLRRLAERLQESPDPASRLLDAEPAPVAPAAPEPLPDLLAAKVTPAAPTATAETTEPATGGKLAHFGLRPGTRSGATAPAATASETTPPAAHAPESPAPAASGEATEDDGDAADSGATPDDSTPAGDDH